MPRAQLRHAAAERRSLRPGSAVGLKPAATCVKDPFPNDRRRLQPDGNQRETGGSVTKLCAGPAVDASPPEAPGALFTRLGNPQWVSVRFGAPWTLPNDGPSGGGALGRSPRALRRLPRCWEPTMQPVRARGTGRSLASVLPGRRDEGWEKLRPVRCCTTGPSGEHLVQCVRQGVPTASQRVTVPAGRDARVLFDDT